MLYDQFNALFRIYIQSKKEQAAGRAGTSFHMVQILQVESFGFSKNKEFAFFAARFEEIYLNKFNFDLEGMLFFAA